MKTSKGLGSGFYVEKNKVITNYHVIENSTSVNIENFNGKKGSAKIIKADKMRDLALLEVNLKGKPVELSSEALYSGMQVAALGHPSGLSFSMTHSTQASSANCWLFRARARDYFSSQPRLTFPPQQCS